MNLKDVWREGRREWRRRRGVKRSQGSLKAQEEALESQTTTLGSLAWEQGLDLSPWPDLQRGLKARQTEWEQVERDRDAAQRDLSEVETRLSTETEACRKEMSAMKDRLQAARGAVEEINQRLRSRERERDRNESKSRESGREVEHLNRKLGTPGLAESERQELIAALEGQNRQIEALLKEREGLQALLEEEETALQPRLKAQEVLEQEHETLERHHRELLSGIQAQQKSLKGQWDHLSRTLEGVLEARTTLFNELGQKVLQTGTAPQGLEAPWQALENTRAQIRNTSHGLKQLEERANPQATKAFRILCLLLSGSLLLLLGLASVLFIKW